MKTTMPPESAPPAPSPFSVVGIGASAGGLEALSALLRSLTVENVAFVVVQHLAPHQPSMLTELLGRASALPVVTVDDGASVLPGRVYVIPPDADLSIRSGNLHLAPPIKSDDRVHLPIDSFFASLAEDRGPSAIGVVLSGTGTDGTHGLAAIKAAGGITFVQDPASAKFDGMPRNALESGAADFCLSPEAIAAEIALVTQHPVAQGPASAEPPEEHMGPLRALIQDAFGIDVGHYNPNMIGRRLRRRMAIRRIERVDDYLRLCQTEPKELAALHRDLLISVTSFFRDREPFEVLAARVLPRVVAGKKDGDSIRIWVPGCASGEEPYSIAICLLEQLEASHRDVKVQIFGTDVDDEGLQQAQRGIYPARIAADVSPERLRRFFVRIDDDRYQVSRRLRDTIVFSSHDLCQDAPFSRLDLVSCRNLLIYLKLGVQRNILRSFHRALLPEGFLMLGVAETVGESAELFSAVDRKNKIYSSGYTPRVAPIDRGARVPAATQRPQAPRLRARRPTISIGQLADHKILDQYAPPGVVVDRNLEILHFRGRAAPYLEQPSGAVTHNLLRLLRPELHAPVEKTIEQALASNEVAAVEAQVTDEQHDLRPIHIVVQPIEEPETKAHCLLIVFQEPSPVRQPAPPAAPMSPDVRVRQLEHELALTKEYLQTTIEEVERANEDLTAGQEELQSANEELQGTNEELETSREELQSTNEELITLNEELQNRMRDLGVVNDDLTNVLLGVDRPVIIVDVDLRIRRFTHGAERVVKLAPADVGRPVSRVDSFLGDTGIEKLISEAIAGFSTVEREIQCADHRWYLVRIVPHKTADQTIGGAVITLIDIEVPKRRAELTRAVDEYAAELLGAVQHPLLILNGDLAVIWANEPYYQRFGVLREEIVGARLASVGNGRWANPLLETALAKTIASGAPFRDLQIDVPVVADRRRFVRVGGSRIRGVANETVLILLSIEGAETPTALFPARDGPR